MCTEVCTPPAGLYCFLVSNSMWLFKSLSVAADAASAETVTICIHASGTQLCWEQSHHQQNDLARAASSVQHANSVASDTAVLCVSICCTAKMKNAETDAGIGISACVEAVLTCKTPAVLTQGLCIQRGKQSGQCWPVNQPVQMTVQTCNHTCFSHRLT